MQVGAVQDEEAMAPVTTSLVKPIESYGKYKNERVKNLFKEWRNGGPKADIAPEHIQYIIDFEFAESIPPKRKQLLDAVLREPEQKPVYKDRFDPLTGKKMPHEQRWRYNPENGASFSDKGLHYEQGQYVEFLGTNMEWQLASVRRIVRLAPEDWEPEFEDDEPDYEYFYNVGNASLVDPKKVRAPEEGLKLVFGFRPWIWQQWALLQVETTTRFCQDHDMDFEAINFRKAAKDLWDYWFNNKKNEEFKNHVLAVEEAYPGSQDKLLQHILSPFVLMDEVSKNRERWGLEGEVNVFMYISILGSGFITCFVTLLIQFTVPILLLQSAINGGVGGDESRFVVPNGSDIDGWDQFCGGGGQLQGRLMNITVLLLYMVRVLPALMFEFFSSSGASDSANDRLNELRRIIWLQGDDTVWQQIGFKVNKYMNGVYVAAIMSVMLFILFLTDDIFEIILNALALEFVHSLDEELSSGEWFDPGARWITAGATELVFRATLRLDFLIDWKNFCREFDISTTKYKELFNGKPVPLKDYYQGRKDMQDPSLMSQKSRYYNQAAAIAKKTNNKLALWNFAETVEVFGIWDMLRVQLGLLDIGMFCRYRDYCVWSRWNKVLYLANVPSVGTWNTTRALASNNLEKVQDDNTTKTSQKGIVLDTLGGAGAGLCKCLRKSVSTLTGKREVVDILNYQDDTELSPMVQFRNDLIDILLFQGVFRSAGLAIYRKEYGAIIFRIIDGMIDWLSYVYQLMFPFILILFCYLVIACY